MFKDGSHLSRTNQPSFLKILPELLLGLLIMYHIDNSELMSR
ncbi:unnamed protein product [Acanthoscelides obtectus]|uniref:Uncharacterized protein n=1 Tax=Acanthoscelides obtectus TaxID=200917 RepID=A0A9P0K920_ACAOB|nr:unnamed protein product [Acanthoscelides obtectus]CAK1666344.1 hypothetical protein AOBTE_LOCUS25268 [Acanthoscelides obtectus]